VAGYDYDAYGQLFASSGSADESYLYTGQQFDDLTGLYSLRARYYDPSLGRFLSRDTWAYDLGSPIEMNRYGYVGANPVNRYDPSGYYGLGYGLLTRTVRGIAGALSGAIGGAVFSYLTSAFTYAFSLIGFCGEDRRLGAQLTDYNALMSNTVQMGAFWGAVTGFGQGFVGVSGNVALALDVFDFMSEVHSLLKSDNVTICDVAPLLIDAVSIVGDARTNFSGDGIRAGGGGDTNTRTVPVDTTPPSSCARSFTADTPVSTDEGLVPIAEIEVGDQLLGYSEDTGELGYYTVTDTLVHVDTLVLDLVIDGEHITTTPDHPFYTPEGEWVYAGTLLIGDAVVSADGDYGYIEDWELRVVEQPMYTLSVAGARNYHVGQGQWLVHNCDPKPLLHQEGNVGTFRQLDKDGEPFDDLTPHHMPPNSYMENQSKNGQFTFEYSEGAGISFNMQTDRHMRTDSFKSKARDYKNMSPRDALARAVWDTRRIYREDGLYGPHIATGLREVIKLNKSTYSELFSKHGLGG
jgi:RHS repeat-associated protein